MDEKRNKTLGKLQVRQITSYQFVFFHFQVSFSGLEIADKKAALKRPIPGPACAPTDSRPTARTESSRAKRALGFR